MENKKNREKSQADILVDLPSKVGAQFFQDQFARAHVRIWIDDHWEIWLCRSNRFKNWLSREYWRRGKKVPSGAALSDAIGALEGKALFGGSSEILYNRVALHNGAIYYDLADQRWRAVKIFPGGWELTTNPPILFRRYTHQQPQVEPVSGGDLKKLFFFVNIPAPSEQLLFSVHLVTCLIPGIPHPVVVLHGDQGSAKTTAARIGGRLIDPSSTETLTLPRTEAELIQQLSHHWFPLFDNVGWLSHWTSDALCRAVTGEGFSKRELYTDDEDVIYGFQCCVGLNGINVAVRRPDLMDRSILYQLPPIPKSKRRPEEEILCEFEEFRAEFVGALLDALCLAMHFVSEITLGELPRMADFAKWGAAIAIALGYSEDEFLGAYQKNVALHNDEVLAGEAVAILVLALMDSRRKWEGSATELLNLFIKLARDRGFGPGDLPRGANALTRRLNELRPNLAAVGIEITTIRTGTERLVRIVKSA